MTMKPTTERDMWRWSDEIRSVTGHSETRKLFHRRWRGQLKRETKLALQTRAEVI